MINFKILKKSKMDKICIIGVGFVGEHLLTNFNRHYNVVGVDLSSKRVFFLKSKYKTKTKNKTNISFQSSYDNLQDCNVFLVSVPTLVTKEREIDVSCLHSVRDSLRSIVKPGSLIMIESSVYVGATRELFGEFLERGVYVGFSPERVDPGRVEPLMHQIPKIISGLNESSLQVCKNIYEKVFDKVVPVSSCECAEMCKLYENCFRMINISYVNEISDMCENIGINTYEMINASSSKPFGFMPFYPGIGVGGHCIPVNPYYLFKTGNLPVLEYATELMNRRPEQKADEIAAKYDCKNILLTGIGFKKGESLLTNSPGYELYKQLKVIGKVVTVYDPIVQDCYMKNDIVFCSRNQFTLENLHDKYDLILVNLILLK